MKIENAKIRNPEQEAPRKSKLRSSVYTEDYRGEYYNISIDKLLPFKNQARKFFDENSLRELSLTIKEYGIRQPLTVISADNNEGYYEIVSGERRYKAAILAGLKVVPCIILYDSKKAEEIAIIENIQREDLHPIELMRAYDNMLQQKICMSTRQIAEKLGISKSVVVEIMNLKNLSENIQNLLIQNKVINRDFFRKLCKTPLEEQQKLVENFLNNILKASKPNSKNVRIISLILSNGKIIIENNKVNKLSSEEKNLAQNAINKLFGSLEI